MKRIIVLAFWALAFFGSYAQDLKPDGFYDFVVKDIDGKEFKLRDLKGKKVMVVNTASKCGFTPQYEQLQELYTQFGGEKFVIIGFPANNFKGQEPGSNEQIREFCTSKFDITFPMMSKRSVKGDDMDPLYQWLTRKELNGVLDSEVKWNFQKYLLDEKGALVKVIPSKESPMSEEIVRWITK
jgi:glutathione peroxidase